MKHLIKKILSIISPRKRIRKLIKKLFPHPNFYQKAKKIGITSVKRNPQLIVSMTSYPARLNKIHYAINTLLNQTLKPDKLILWLTAEQFPNREKDLPDSLLALCNYGLTIDWYKDDIKSYTKLIPSLIKYPNDIIVVADDDIYYRPNWLSILYKSYLQNPDMIHGHRIREIKFDDNDNILPYNEWGFAKSTNKSYLNFQTGVGGVLYPPNTLHNDVFKQELLLKLSPKADDIWFWAMAVLNKSLIKNIKSKNHKTLLVGEEGQGDLWEINSKGYNDIQMQNVLKHYPVLKETILNEWKKRINSTN